MSADWRIWLYETLSAALPLVPALPAEDIYASGSLTAPPETYPFLVVKMEPTVPGPYPGAQRARCSLWCHDEPGSYLAIDGVLRSARLALVGAGARVGRVVGVGGGIGVMWQGDSQDLADDIFKTIFKTSTYDLLGREAES